MIGSVYKISASSDWKPEPQSDLSPVRCYAIGAYNHRVKGSDNSLVNGANSSNRTAGVFLSVVVPKLVILIADILFVGLVFVMFLMVVLVMVMFSIDLR